MILPNDILLRATSDGQTVWVSQRLVCEVCGLDEDYLRKACRDRYKSSLRASWQAVTTQEEFYLGDNPAKSWRWGRRGGQYYYDYDRIPNRKPTCYRDQLPSKEELIAVVEGRNLIGSRERQAEVKRMIAERVCQCANLDDQRFFAEFALDEMCLFNSSNARKLAQAAAWCRYVKYAVTTEAWHELGLATQQEFYAVCADMLAKEGLTGLRIKTAESLRKKISALPSGDAMLAALVSGKYGNSNRQIIGKIDLVDPTTGEVMREDAHAATIMSYWLNPGGAEKDSKRSLYDLYAYDMECLGYVPVALSTFNHYTNRWDRQYLSAGERHGEAYAKNAFRPYVPSKPLEYANSLWVSDGSGVVPYRYQDQHGKWRMMKIYVMLITDVGSRYMAGYAVSRKGEHIEDAKMLREAMRMALINNGKTSVMDFLTDNHGAYTGSEAQSYLSMAVSCHRTIAPHDSQANPAECIFRLFKRRFKSYFKLPETSWSAKSLESMANPDYYDIMSLPTFGEAINRLDQAISDWNTTPLRIGKTPEELFRDHKNPAAGEMSDRRYRMVTGNVSKRDISMARSVLVVERKDVEYKFDIPTDTDTLALIARHIGYASKLEVVAYWDEHGADLYTTNGVYMLTCAPCPLASKTYAEATIDGQRALGHHLKKAETYDAITAAYVEDVINAKKVLSPNYAFNVQDSNTKEDYNAMHEAISEATYNKALAKEETKVKRAEARQQAKADKDFAARYRDQMAANVSNINQYLNK